MCYWARRPSRTGVLQARSPCCAAFQLTVLSCFALHRKQWFICSEPSTEPDVECTEESFHSQMSPHEEEKSYLCKAPKLQDMSKYEQD